MTLASRAEALFISNLQPSEHPTADQLAAAIRASLRAHGGSRGCAGAFAAEYIEHPETARDRMRWALAAAADQTSVRAAFRDS